MRHRILAVMVCLAMCCGIGWATYAWFTRDPTPIKLDSKIYDDYAGYYDFGHNTVVTIRREGDRLIASTPEQITRQLLPETETRFFVKGEPARLTFHRNETGRVDYAISQWKKLEEKAQKIPALPPVLECTNAMIAATTGGKAVEAGLAILK